MIALCSGGFSVLHVGHIEYFEQASKYGEVVVALNSDEWMKRKYSFVVMPWLERRRILMSLRVISDVTPVCDDDGTVCEAIRRIRPDFFVNGGDRSESETREHLSCVECGTIEVFCKTNDVHSSDFIRKIR